MHLILVRQDLEGFQQVRPQPTGQPGEYGLEVTIPEAGSRVLYAEFTRANGQDIVQRDVLTVGVTTSGAAALAEDLTPKVQGDARVALLDAEGIVAGQGARLISQVEDARTGQGLEHPSALPGPPAHVVMLNADAGAFAHTHGEQVEAAGHSAASDAGHGEHGAAGITHGPAIAFHHTFLTPGLYKAWGQFQAQDGRVVTADFVVWVH